MGPNAGGRRFGKATDCRNGGMGPATSTLWRGSGVYSIWPFCCLPWVQGQQG